MRTIYTYILNKRFSSKYPGYWVWYIPKDGWQVEQSKCNYNNEDEDEWVHQYIKRALNTESEKSVKSIFSL